MTEHRNKAGDTETTSNEFIKRETGEQHNPKVPAENPGNTSPNSDDLENSDQKTDKPHPNDADVAKKIKDANE